MGPGVETPPARPGSFTRPLSAHPEPLLHPWWVTVVSACLHEEARTCLGAPSCPHILGLSFHLGMGLSTPRAHQEWFLKSAGVGRERQASRRVAWAVLWGSDSHRGGGPSFLRTGWAGTGLDA